MKMIIVNQGNALDHPGVEGYYLTCVHQARKRNTTWVHLGTKYYKGEPSYAPSVRTWVHMTTYKLDGTPH